MVQKVWRRAGVQRVESRVEAHFEVAFKETLIEIPFTYVASRESSE